MALKDDYYTLSQFAEFFNVTRQTVSRWLKNGEIVGEKIGREVLIHKNEFDKLGDKFDRNIGKYFIREIANNIRKIYNYSKEDKVQPIGKDGEYIIFGITKRDGFKSRVRVRTLEYVEDESVINFEISEEKKN